MFLKDGGTGSRIWELSWSVGSKALHNWMVGDDVPVSWNIILLSSPGLMIDPKTEAQNLSK